MQSIELKEDGIHIDGKAIKLGDKIADLPKSIDGLYDTFSATDAVSMDDEEITEITFSLNGMDMFMATSYDKLTIAWISVTSPDIRVEILDRVYGVGDAFPDVVKKNELAWDDAYGGMFFYKEYAIPYDTEKNEIVSISIGETPF